MKVLGIDEAGRGPVIGPMIVAGVMIEDGKEAMLGEVKDSKLLTPRKRRLLGTNIRKITENLILVIHPKEIDDALLSDYLNLNWLEANKQAEIINKLKPDVAIIDCPSPNCIKYTEYLKNLLNNKKIKLIVEHKADMNYPVVSAASIIAKEKREKEMKKIKRKYGNTGPGYPANPITQKFIKDNWNKCPEIFRKTWSTFKNIEKMKNQTRVMDY